MRFKRNNFYRRRSIFNRFFLYFLIVLYTLSFASCLDKHEDEILECPRYEEQRPLDTNKTVPDDIQINFWIGDPDVNGITNAETEISMEASDPQFAEFVAMRRAELTKFYAVIDSCKDFDRNTYEVLTNGITDDFVDLNPNDHRNLYQEKNSGYESSVSSGSSHGYESSSSVSKHMFNTGEMLKDPIFLDSTSFDPNDSISSTISTSLDKDEYDFLN